ncbi:MAG: hypothetical protein HY984_00115 [Candidatus Magasanikbacteria bacterium]|nr:hypothetical protein [Candidatus Magasanikbacteria bacterium]
MTLVPGRISRVIFSTSRGRWVAPK